MLIDLLLVAVWVAGIGVSRRIFNDVFTPLCVYVSSWCACLLLFRLRLVEYADLEPKTWLLIAAGIVSFCVGCLACATCMHKPCRPQRKVFTSLPWLRAAILVLLILDLVGFAFFAARMSDVYGLQTYFTDPGIIRADGREWTSTGAVGLLMLLCYPLFVSSLLHVLESRKPTWLTILGLAVPAAETYLLTDRLTLVIFFTCGFFIWIYHRRHITFNRKVFYSFGAGLICVLIYFSAVGSLYRKLVTPSSPLFQYSTISSNSGLGLKILDPYIYVTASFPTFQAAMHDVDRMSWGMQTFYPVARLLYGIDALDRKPEAADFDFYFVPIPFNTYTWLYSFYSDFGVFGVLLIPGLIGGFETWLYMRMKETPTMFSLSGAAALAAATTFTTFVYIQYDFMLWVFLVVMFLVSKRVCSERNGHFIAKPGRAFGRRETVQPARTLVS